MSLPSGLIFFLDFVYSDANGGSPRTGNTAGESTWYQSSWPGVINGVDLVTSGGVGFLVLVVMVVGYAYASATGSVVGPIVNTKCTEQAFILNGISKQTLS